MIRITRPPKPAELTDDMQAALTAEFKANGTAVWRKDWIVDTLKAATYSKCAFSEMRLDEEGKYTQIEHFNPKSRYPDEVVEWTNLLPICNVCNSKKWNWDTKQKPLVNPMDEDPKEFFFIRNGRINARDVSNKKATDTIEQYDLNNSEQLRPVRCAIEKKIQEDLAEYQTHYSQDKDYWSGKLLRLMASSGRQSAYSATKATAILLDNSYSLLKQTLAEEGRWVPEFEQAEHELAFCALI